MTTNFILSIQKNRTDRNVPWMICITLKIVFVHELFINIKRIGFVGGETIKKLCFEM